MKKIVIALSIAFALGAAQAWAGPACEGTLKDTNGDNVVEEGTGSCDCFDPAGGDQPGAPNGPSGCIVLGGDPGYVCAGGGAGGGGCIGGQGDPGELFVCVSAAGPVPCDEAGCRAAAEAGCQ
jgi:hypothetical protein